MVGELKVMWGGVQITFLLISFLMCDATAVTVIKCGDGHLAFPFHTGNTAQKYPIAGAGDAGDTGDSDAQRIPVNWLNYRFGCSGFWGEGGALLLTIVSGGHWLMVNRTPCPCQIVPGRIRRP